MKSWIKIFAVLAVALCTVVIVTDAHRHSAEHNRRHHSRQGKECPRGMVNQTSTVRNETCKCTARVERERLWGRERNVTHYRWNCANGTTTTTTVAPPSSTTTSNIASTTLAPTTTSSTTTVSTTTAAG